MSKTRCFIDCIHLICVIFGKYQSQKALNMVKNAISAIRMSVKCQKCVGQLTHKKSGQLTKLVDISKCVDIIATCHDDI